MAQAILQKIIEQYGLDWYVDSAGLRDFNIGKPMNERAARILLENGLSSYHVGRIVSLFL